MAKGSKTITNEETYTINNCLDNVTITAYGGKGYGGSGGNGGKTVATYSPAKNSNIRALFVSFVAGTGGTCGCGSSGGCGYRGGSTAFVRTSSTVLLTAGGGGGASESNNYCGGAGGGGFDGCGGCISGGGGGSGYCRSGLDCNGTSGVNSGNGKAIIRW